MNNVPDIVLFIGRFHPLIVHLPIGFLVFAFLLELFSRWKKDETFARAIPLALVGSAISAFIASILGYMLSLSDDYETNMLDTHFWFGVATTLATILAYFIRIDKIKILRFSKVKSNISTVTLLVVLVSITGHYGGNLTHGSDYLIKYLPFSNAEKTKLVAVTKIEDATVFNHLVHPILDAKCASCHNESKKKGGLSFKDSLTILKGGKNGAILVAGDALKSEMIKRLLLNPDHKHFMPPKGKTPLTEAEIAILTFWINNNNKTFDYKLGTVKAPESILKIASSRLGLSSVGSSNQLTVPVAKKIDNTIINDLIAEGFRVTELVFDSNLYEVVLPAKTVSFANANTIKTKLEKLLKIKDNVLWLYLEDNQINDDDINTINKFENLQKLKLNKNPITDSGVSKLVNNKNIKSLNLYHTKITKISLASFYQMKNLKNVYVWQTALTARDTVGYYKASKNNLNIVFGY